jgi:hypothetical protein
MPREQVEAAYRGDWMSRKVIDIPAYDATREWRTWQAEANDISAISDLEKTSAFSARPCRPCSARDCTAGPR